MLSSCFSVSLTANLNPQNHLMFLRWNTYDFINFSLGKRRISGETERFSKIELIDYENKFMYYGV
jgi:hypothetical protein